MTDEPTSRQDHDQRFKTLLKEFIGPFFSLFWPDRAALYDFSSVEWLENEAFPDPPEGSRRSLDLVCKVPTLQPVSTARGELSTGTVVILHVEIESADTVEPLRLRMFKYFACLRQKYDDPILPVAVYLRVGLNGVGEDGYREALGDFAIVQYNYLYVGLPALEAETYLHRDALAAALSATMAIPADRRPEFKAESLRRVYISSENEYRKFLLTEFVQAYLPLERPEEKQEFEQLLETEKYGEVKKMATTWYEQGLEEGVKRGLLAAVIQVVETRFGSVPLELHQRLDAYSDEQLSEILKLASKANTLDEIRLDGLPQ